MALFGRKKDDGPVIREQAAELHWDTDDPFLFASHHFDLYPKGNELQAPPYEQVKKKDLGQDYYKLFGYRMYTGKVTPGFQLHAHWGYETVTVASQGFIDHFDSLGNQGRFGCGDLQWVTAGGRYHHCEMYPLVFQDRDNPQLVTQIMINLPLDRKNTPTEVHTVWKEEIPALTGDGWTASLISGEFGGLSAKPPSENSWAADPSHHVLILKLTMDPGAEFELPPSPSVNRNIYITEGKASVGEKEYRAGTRLKVRPDRTLNITMGDTRSEVWVLEGDPIGEKQAAWGPAVLGTVKEVRDANNEIREKELEDWKWDYVNQKQPLGTERFFRNADGTEDRPPKEKERNIVL